MLILILFGFFYYFFFFFSLFFFAVYLQRTANSVFTQIMHPKVQPQPQPEHPLEQAKEEEHVEHPMRRAHK